MSGSSILRELDPEVAPGDLLYATLAEEVDQDIIINEIRHRTGKIIQLSYKGQAQDDVPSLCNNWRAPFQNLINPLLMSF